MGESEGGSRDGEVHGGVSVSGKNREELLHKEFLVVTDGAEETVMQQMPGNILSQKS